MSKITIAKVGGKSVTPADFLAYDVDGTNGLKLEGTGGLKTSICILTRFRHKGAGNARLWTRVLHATLDDATDKWSVTTEPLYKGKYLLVAGEETDQVQAVYLNVDGKPDPDRQPGGLKICLAITVVEAASDHITVTGCAIYPAEPVQCSLTSIDKATGQRRANTVTSYKPTVTGLVAPHSWQVTFRPLELGQLAFSECYAFTAVSYEGTVHDTITVP